MREEDKRSLALVVAGSLSGFIIAASSLPLFVKTLSITLLLIAIVLLLLYGVGIPQTKYHAFRLRHRWKEPLKIGILNDMKWDKNNQEIFAWSDVPPSEWKTAIQAFAKERKVSVEVNLIDVGKSFDSYVAILNPYGGVYPELDLKNLSTLEKIANYVKEGALFINVADIPAYWAYSPDLHRKVDTTTTIYGLFATSSGVQILGTKPFETSALIKKLNLRVVGFAQRIPQTLTTKPSWVFNTERAAIVESNVTSCVPTTRQLYTDGNMYDFSGLFFCEVRRRRFLIFVNMDKCGLS